MVDSTPSAPSDNLPTGFSLAGIHCGIKTDAAKEDLTLILIDRPATAAGVYTQNKFAAAPVVLDRKRTPGQSIRAVIINSGNANACTGQRGLEDATEMCRVTASACSIEAEEVLVMSTGVIGNFLPMDAIQSGIAKVATALGNDTEAVLSAARGMLTTDSCTKTVQRNWKGASLFGMAKGAAMIGPRMATMLGIILTDVAIDAEVAQRLLVAAVEESFHCIHVDGHTSTNDTVLLVASGASGVEVTAETEEEFGHLLSESCEALARSIPADGEGATHLITIHVRGCRTKEDARKIAHTVADSPLVKTAIAGADPNWGRIVSAAGYADVPFDPQRLELRLNGHLLFSALRPTHFDEAEISESIRSAKEVCIDLSFSEGDAETRFWTTDLTSEYVRLNADYRT
jgi:glutamate N-acetyltransferase / amino-acid N-acetyltransferase